LSPKDKILTFRPDEQVYTAMERMRADDGVPFSEQIRRALRAWLTEKGKMVPSLSARATAGAIKRRHGKIVERSVELMNAKRRK
jgi:Arc/MetJ-type ribon-helix-helix transcriptional regulator